MAGRLTVVTPARQELKIRLDRNFIIFHSLFNLSWTEDVQLCHPGNSSCRSAKIGFADVIIYICLTICLTI